MVHTPLGPPITWVHILLKTLDALITYTMMTDGRESKLHFVMIGGVFHFRLELFGSTI